MLGNFQVCNNYFFQHPYYNSINILPLGGNAYYTLNNKKNKYAIQNHRRLVL